MLDVGGPYSPGIPLPFNSKRKAVNTDGEEGLVGKGVTSMVHHEGQTSPTCGYYSSSVSLLFAWVLLGLKATPTITPFLGHLHGFL